MTDLLSEEERAAQEDGRYQPTVVEALSRIMRDVQSISKDSRNTQQNFNFRGVDAVVNAVGPVLREHVVDLWRDLLGEIAEPRLIRADLRRHHIGGASRRQPSCLGEELIGETRAILRGRPCHEVAPRATGLLLCGDNPLTLSPPLFSSTLLSFAEWTT